MNSDPLDDAAEATELMLQEALAKKAPVPEKTGFCLECDEPTAGAFCSRECRETYEKRERMNKIKGN
jgi:hypothetical protein